MPDEFDERPGDLDQPPAFFPYGEEEEDAGDPGRPVEVTVRDIYKGQVGDQVTWYVLLDSGEASVPIMIGPFESVAIAMVKEGRAPDRPLTHDLFKTVLLRLGYVVDRVIIDDLVNATYYAKVFLVKGDKELEIDSRPSDAIALALRFEAPIYLTQRVIDNAGSEE